MKDDKDFKDLFKKVFLNPIFEQNTLASQEGLEVGEEKAFSIKRTSTGSSFFNLTMTNVEKLYPDYNLESFYSLNSFGLRSDELTQVHNGKHILFAGCSNTFGAGNFLEDTWAHKLYSKIAETEKLSGFFNIGVSSMSMTGIIAQIISYFRLFGYPDVLFINFPDFTRETKKILMSTAQLSKTDYESSINKNVVSRSLVAQYSMLKDICDSHGVRIFSMTWETQLQIEVKGEPDPRKYFENLYIPKDDELAQHQVDFSDKHRDHPRARYFLRALDRDHQGIAIHDFWYNKMYQMYMKDR